MTNAIKYSLLKYLFIGFLTLFSFKLLQTEYYDWTGKLNCQQKCETLNLGKCQYTKTETNSRCLCTEKQIYLVLN